MRSVVLGIALLVIFALVSREAQVVLQISLAVAFTLVLFISVLIDLGKVYKPKTEEEFDEPLAGELAEETSEPEEAEAIVVEAESAPDVKKSS